MAIVTKVATADVNAHSIMYAPQTSGLKAGEDLPAVAFCKIASDGTVMLAADGDTFTGITKKDYLAGEAVTLYGLGAEAQYTVEGALTPGAVFYLPASANKGKLSDAVVTANVRPVAQAVSTRRIRVIAAI